MTKEVLFAQRSFVNELGLLVDRHSMADDCMREKFADFATDMLCLIDGCTDTPCHVFLSIGTYPDHLVSGNLHHHFSRYCKLSTAEIRKNDSLKLKKMAEENDEVLI